MILLLITLEGNDGLCLDNEEEHRQLAATFAGALVAAGRKEPESECGTKQEQKKSRWPTPIIERLDIETLEEWEFDSGGCEATDGCWVEPDGVCEHSHPS